TRPALPACACSSCTSPPPSRFYPLSLHDALPILNESLPDSLTSVDKIDALSRIRLIDRFWRLVGDNPFGIPAITVLQGYYRPNVERIVSVDLPKLEFANGKIVEPPTQRDAHEYKKHYRCRSELLVRYGLCRFPPAIHRKVQCEHR